MKKTHQQQQRRRVIKIYNKEEGDRNQLEMKAPQTKLRTGQQHQIIQRNNAPSQLSFDLPIEHRYGNNIVLILSKVKLGFFSHLATSVTVISFACQHATGYLTNRF